MATLDVSKKVLLLKLQLAESTESKTVLETLNKLQELDITIDILAKTGIGKAVNSLRKHGDAGEFAKSLVRHWKKLVPKESQSHTEDGAASQTKHSKTAGNLNSSTDEFVKNEDQKSPDLNKKCSETDDQDQTSSKGDHLKAEDKKPDILERDEPQELERKAEVDKEEESEREEEGVEEKGEEEVEINERERLEERNSKIKHVLDHQEKVKKPTEQKSHYICESEKSNNLKNKLDKQESKGDIFLNSLKKHRHCRDSDDDHDDFQQSKNNRKKSRPVSNSDKHRMKNSAKRDSDKKHLSCPRPWTTETKSDCNGNSTLLDIDNLQVNKKAVKEADSLVCDHKKREPSERRQLCIETKERPAHNSKKTKDKKVTNITEEDLQVPSMSFESYLSYDLKAPRRKKRSGDSKKPTKKCKTSEKEERTTKEPIIEFTELPTESEESNPKVKGSVMDLLNVPLPTLLPECDELSYFPYIHTKEEEKVSRPSDVPQEALIFTGQRLNKKMQVYSGVKTTYLPTMMTLYQQCIRALQNNIDLLYEIGGVPFEILEPVLERCTPDQLLRIEECNPAYIGLTDHLWGKHCRRDFRNAQLEEYESWREMHLRLSEERERKLQRLTKTIVSAHSGKPKGRQVKLAFINSVAKPPRNVRIQQEIYGTAGAIQQSHPLDRPSVKAPDNRPRPSHVEPSRPLTTASGLSQAQDPRKKGRVAPMMAKSLKAFKKQLGRR